MVDLVTAGMSSDSFFSYLRDTVGSLSSDLATLVYFLLSIATPFGTLGIKMDLLDYTLAAPRSRPTDALADQVRVQLRGALAQAGVRRRSWMQSPRQVLAGLKEQQRVQHHPAGLAQQLASLEFEPVAEIRQYRCAGLRSGTLTPGSLPASSSR